MFHQVPFRCRTLLLLVVMVAGLTTNLAVATPSHKVLDAPLPVHGKGQAAPWFQEASRKYADASSKLLSYLERAGKGTGNGIAPADLGRTHLMITHFQRLGRWMEIFGEPSGADFRMRGGVMKVHLGKLILASQSLRTTQNYIEKVRLEIAKSTPKRLARAADIEKMCAQQKWEAAEKELNDVFDDMEPGTVFLTNEERIEIFKPFLEASSAIERAMTAKRSTEAKAELVAAIQGLQPMYPAKLQEIAAAVDSVAATGNATWRGEMVAGPQLAERVAQLWRETQVQVQQMRAKMWALNLRTFANNVYETSSAIIEPNAGDPVATEFSQFSQLLGAQLVRLVEADGTRATVDVAARLYGEYLVALAPVARQVNDAAWTTQLTVALGKFQGKVPDLDRQIQGYHQATDDLLRWRARVATVQARAKSQLYAPLSQTFQAATTSGKVGEADYIGLLVAPPSPPQQPQLLTDAPDIMPIAVQRLLGKQVMVADVVRISADSKAAIARYAGRTYANVPTPMALQSEVAALKASLMVSDQAPPLSLRAMSAVVTADRQDLVTVGGTISGAYLEGLITRFATLPVSAAVLMRLGELPPERLDGTGLVNMLMRFEITPQWVQHDYFFLDLASPLTQPVAEVARLPTAL